MLRTLRRISMTYVAYVLLLLAFVALGTFVYALATDSALAGTIGGTLVVLMVASVVGFRIGARNRAKSNDSGIEIEGANVWAQPLRREQIDRYLLSYRGVQDGHEQNGAGGLRRRGRTHQRDRSARGLTADVVHHVCRQFGEDTRRLPVVYICDLMLALRMAALDYR